MQEHERTAACCCRKPARGQANQDATAKPACLAPVIPLSEELIMKKRDDFVVTNVLDAKVASEVFLQEVQPRPLQPGNKVERREQHSGCGKPLAIQYAFTDQPSSMPSQTTLTCLSERSSKSMKRNSEAAVTEPSGISTAPPVVVGADRAGAARLSPFPWPAANVDHFITWPCDIAECLGEQF
jgi:hypothetical protein